MKTKTVLPSYRLQELGLEMFNKDFDTLNYTQKSKIKDVFLAELLLANKTVTIEPLTTQYELKRNGVLIYTGTEENCYFELQREQSQSADYAMKYGGWTINPKNK